MFGIDDAVLIPAAVSAVSAGLNFFGNKERNQVQQDLANQANAFSAQQYATRYQTTVEDLTKAGLNPMLAYGQGAGSPPSAVSPAMQTNKWEGVPQAIHAGIGAANVKADLSMKEAQTIESISRTGVNDEDRKLKDAQTKLAILEADFVPAKIKQAISQSLLNDALRGAASANEAASRLDTLIRKTGDLPEAESKGKYHKTTPYNPYMFKDFTQGVSSATQAFGALKGTKVVPHVSDFTYGR